MQKVIAPIKHEWTAADKLREDARRVLRIASALNTLQNEGLVEREQCNSIAERVTIQIR